MENIKIRDLKREDIPYIVDIQINGWKAAYKGIIEDEYLNSMNREERIRKRENDYKEFNYIVAELNSEIVGFCKYIDNNTHTPNIEDIDCEIIALYVRPDMKYKGIGTTLFNYAKKEFISKNKKKMIIWCLKDNEPSKLFYKKMGGNIFKEKDIKIGDIYYKEVGFLYNLERI